MMNCKQPELYALNAERRTAGFETEDQVRHEMIWQHIRGEGQPGMPAHLSGCRDCRELAESFRRLDQTLHSKTATTLAVCPPPEVLADYQHGLLDPDHREKVARHLEACDLCRGEIDWLRETAPQAKVVEISRRKVFLWVGSAAAAIMAGFFGWQATGPQSPYADLAAVPGIDRVDLLKTLGKDEFVQSAFLAGVDAYGRGDVRTALARMDEILAGDPRNSSALLVKGLAAYRQGNVREAHRLVDTSEEIRPKSGYRCWVALQFALLTGDKTGIQRECKHVEGHPEYTEASRRIAQEVERRQTI